MGNLCTGGVASTGRPSPRTRPGDRAPGPPPRGSTMTPSRSGLLDGLRSRRAPAPDSGAHLRQAHRQVSDLLARASNHPDRQAEEAALHRLEGQIAQAIQNGTPLPHLDAELHHLNWRMQGVEPLRPQEALLQPARHLPSPGPDLHDLPVDHLGPDSDSERSLDSGWGSDRESAGTDEKSIDSDGEAEMLHRMRAGGGLAR